MCVDSSIRSPAQGSMAGKAMILLLSFGAITAALVACSGQDREIEVRFTTAIPDATVRDLRFYLHDLALLDANGMAHTVKFHADTPWQSGRVALIDLAGAGADRNEAARGTVNDAASDFTGVRFTLGVPFDLNHGNPLTAAAPLNRGDLFWAWQTGYKFLRLDLTDQGHEWSFHLGSTGCASASALRPPAAACAQPNLLRVELRGFNPLQTPVTVKLHEWVNAMRAAGYRACTGNYASDPSCTAAYAATGLRIDTGDCAGVCGGQRLFGVE
jgi:uncharacterized repeat protein (TIGR04052 family)